MNKNISYLASLIFSIITLTIFSVMTVLLNELLIVYIGIPFSISIFCFFLYLTQGNLKHTSLNIKYLKQTDTLVYFLTIISVIAVILVPSYEGSIIDWLRIPLLNWLRYGSTLLLTTFLPGYFLLKILDRKEAVKGGALIVISCLLSFFTMFIMGFSILCYGDTITTLAYPAVIVANITLMVAYHFLKKGEKPKIVVTISWPETLLFASLLATVMVGSIAIMIYCSPLSYGDMWRHLGGALQYSQSFPGGGGVLMPGAPYLFQIYLAMLISLSGLPLAVSVQLLYLLGFIPLIALYSTIKEWFSEKTDKRLPSIMIFLSTLLGFGSLYAIFLKLNEPMYSTLQLLWATTSKTYDIYMRILLLPDYVAPLWYIGLPCFFMLLYLIRKNNLGKVARFSLITIITLTAYLGHIAEVTIIVILLLVYDLLCNNRFEWDKHLSFLTGLILVAIVDLIAPSQGYIFLTNNITGEKTVSLTFLITLFLSALTAIAPVLRSRMVSGSPISGKKSFLNIPRIWKYARWFLLYFYLFSMVIWLASLSFYDVWASGNEFFVPFFVFPVRFGAVGILAVLSLFFFLPEIVNDKRLVLFLSLLLVGLALEQIGTQNQSVGNLYPTYRYATFAFVGSCVLAAYGIKKLFAFYNKTFALTEMKKKIIGCTFLFFIIIPSMLSTSLYYVHVSSFYQASGSVTEPELDALNFIAQNLPANASIITFSDNPSSGKLYPFAKVNTIQNLQRYSNILLNEENPYTLIYILGLSNAKYVYMTQKDYEILNSSKGLFKDFLHYFPKVFVNDAVTIYEIPSLTPSSTKASVGVLAFSPSLQGQEKSTWIDDSFTEGWHSHRQYGEVKTYESEVDNGIMEISVISNQSGNIWASYALPLELKTKDSVLSFRYKVDNDYTWFTIILQNATHRFSFYRGHLTDRVFTTKLYSLPDGQIITRIEIMVETTDKSPPQTSAVAQIDSIEISQQPFSEDAVLPSLFTSLLHSPYKVAYIDNLSMENIDTYLSNYTHIILPSDSQFPVESLLEWVSTGNTLIVFNTYGNGFFANLLGITNSSPTLSINNINSGKVLYINSFPKIAIGKESDILQPNFLDEVKTLLTIDEYVQKIDTLPVYNSIFGGIQIQGDLEVNTDILMLQGAINLPNSPFSVNESTALKIYGNITLAIKNATLAISPSESYMLIKPDNYPLEGEILVNASGGPLIIADGNENIIYNSNTSITFKFTSTGTSLCARLPSINASGTITFDQLDVHAALYVPLADIIQQKAEIQGSIKFDTIWISNSLTIFSMFQAKGKILNLAETTAQPTISWVELLTSPCNLVFTAIFVLGIATYTIMKSKTKSLKLTKCNNSI